MPCKSAMTLFAMVVGFGGGVDGAPGPFADDAGEGLWVQPTRKTRQQAAQAANARIRYLICQYPRRFLHRFPDNSRNGSDVALPFLVSSVMRRLLLREGLVDVVEIGL